MKKIITMLAVIGILASCGTPKEEGAEKHQDALHGADAAAPQYTPEMLANTTDYVCGMPTSAGIRDTCHIDNKAYGFCSSECMAEFKKDPAKYLAVK
jgi:YHS domain-containing protein